MNEALRAQILRMARYVDETSERHPLDITRVARQVLVAHAERRFLTAAQIAERINNRVQQFFAENLDVTGSGG